MPSGKTKEDTWKAKDLEKSIKEAKDDRRQHKDRDRDKERDRHRDKDRDREHRKKDRPRDDEHKERRHRDKENDDRTHRDRPKHRDEERKDKDRPRKDRDDREHRRDRHQREERDVRVKATTRKPKIDDYYRTEPRGHHNEDEDNERRRENRRHHRGEDGERRKHRDKDDRQDDRERRSKHRDESGRDKDRRRDKDDKDDSRRRDKDRDENRRHKDRDEDRRHKDRNEDRRPRDPDEEKPRRHKERDEDDEERRKRHEERKARKKREEKEREEQEKLEKERKEKEKAMPHKISQPLNAWADPLSPNGTNYNTAVNPFNALSDQYSHAEFCEVDKNNSGNSPQNDGAAMSDFQEALMRHYSTSGDITQNAAVMSYEAARTAYEEALVQKYKNSLSYEDLDEDDIINEPSPEGSESPDIDGRQCALKNYPETETASITPRSNDNPAHQVDINDPGHQVRDHDKQRETPDLGHQRETLDPYHQGETLDPYHQGETSVTAVYSDNHLIQQGKFDDEDEDFGEFDYDSDFEVYESDFETSPVDTEYVGDNVRDPGKPGKLVKRQMQSKPLSGSRVSIEGQVPLKPTEKMSRVSQNKVQQKRGAVLSNNKSQKLASHNRSVTNRKAPVTQHSNTTNIQGLISPEKSRSVRVSTQGQNLNHSMEKNSPRADTASSLTGTGKQRRGSLIGGRGNQPARVQGSVPSRIQGGNQPARVQGSVPSRIQGGNQAHPSGVHVEVKETPQRYLPGQGHDGPTRNSGGSSGQGVRDNTTRVQQQRRPSQNDKIKPVANNISSDKMTPPRKIQASSPKSRAGSQSVRSSTQRPGVKNSATPLKTSTPLKQNQSNINPNQSQNQPRKKPEGQGQRPEDHGQRLTSQRQRPDTDSRRASFGQKLRSVNQPGNNKKPRGPQKLGSTKSGNVDSRRSRGKPDNIQRRSFKERTGLNGKGLSGVDRTSLYKRDEPSGTVRDGGVELEQLDRYTASSLAVKGSSSNDDEPGNQDIIRLSESDKSLTDLSSIQAPHPPKRGGTPYIRAHNDKPTTVESDPSDTYEDGSEHITVSEEENGDYDYDDDFEDYDDDFEDDDGDDDDDDRDESSNERDTESYDSSQHNNKDKKKFNGEMDEILDAMNKENERLLTESRKPKWSEEPEEKNRRPVSNTKQTFINFVSAKQRQMSTKALSTAARRGYELQEMIELDVSEYDMFDMPPVTEYTMYMRSFGSSNTKQAYVQTNEDNIDRDIQTEEIEYSEKWTQQPPSDILASGGSDDKKFDITEESYQPTDMAHLSEFIERASQVMTILLEEDFLDTLENKHSRSKQSNIIISDAFTEITVPDFLAERPVVYSHFSPVHTHMLLTLHATSTKPSSDLLTRQGCLCVWNVNEPTRPQKVLMCESRPRCCCFSPTKTSLVFAGMVDGSIVCWDTREASSMHKYHKHGDTSWLLRYPTYNTAGVLHYENHQSPVTDISTIVAPGERRQQYHKDDASASLSGLAQAGSGEGLSFQLASLEENGVIHLWVVAELSHSDLAGSESDYGLAPGGKVKLVKSSTIQLESPLRDARYRTTMKCADMQLLPSNNSHYYVATDTGCVVHGLRYGGKAPPRAYRPLVDNLVQVRTVDFSPFPEPVFLTGCEDGSLRLYHIDKEWPVATWPLSTDGCPIRLVRWCRSRPAVFFVLDSESRLHIWDLLMDDSSPLKQEAISKHSVTSLALSNDYSATGLGLPGRRPQMVVCLENGSCEIHTMNQQFSALMADEVDQFSTFLQKNC